MLLLLTGARRNDAQWSEFDLVRGWWLKPADRVKSGKPHRVALSSHAIELLKTMRAESIDKHLFPGRRGPVQTTLTTFWRRACAQAGLQSVRLHDVRHTTASLIASGGGSLMAVQDLLGHRDPTTSRRYAHLFDSVQRQIVESVGAQIVGSGTVGGGRYDGAPEASRA
jgi:integrase